MPTNKDNVPNIFTNTNKTINLFHPNNKVPNDSLNNQFSSNSFNSQVTNNALNNLLKNT
jgi:hypothetical protein